MSKKLKTLIITGVILVILLIAGVLVYTTNKTEIDEYIFQKTFSLDKVVTTVSDDLVSPLGNRTVYDLSKEGQFVLQNAGKPESITFCGETIKLGKFTQRTDVTVDEIVEYLANFSKIAYIEDNKDSNMSDYSGEINIDASTFAEKINEYIDNDMSAENNRFTVIFESGAEIETVSHVHTSSVDHSDCVTETVKDKTNKMEVTIHFAPLHSHSNTDEEHEDKDWTPENIFISHVSLSLYNACQGSISPYNQDREIIADTYVNYPNGISILIWKIGYTIGA